MKILYHGDDDGRCAAAIVVNELRQFGDILTEEDCIEYIHGNAMLLKEEDIREGETVYIVDLALDDVIYFVIKMCLGHNCHITHIDHHKTTLEYYERAVNDDFGVDSTLFNLHFTAFYRIGISGAMLAWIWSCLSTSARNAFLTNYPTEQLHDQYYDLSDTRSHVMLTVPDSNSLEYRIPLIVRLIDDHDVWRHAMEMTKYFHLAFAMERDKHPMNPMWNDLLYAQDQFITEKYLKIGKILFDYQTGRNLRTVNDAHEETIAGIKCLCLNERGNSAIFGDKIHDYPMVCLYHYNRNYWKYSLYSSEESDVDVSQICKEYGGGGHQHAAGFQVPEYIFGKTEQAPVQVQKPSADPQKESFFTKLFRKVLGG